MTDEMSLQIRGSRRVEPFGRATCRVEDEPLVTMTAVDMIADAGFEPIHAANADEAIAILESRDDIRIIFTDINMPGSMDGLKLAQAVQGRWPPIKIVITTAFSVPDQTLMPRGSKFIAKPYEPAQLANALTSVMV